MVKRCSIAMGIPALALMLTVLSGCLDSQGPELNKEPAARSPASGGGGGGEAGAGLSSYNSDELAQALAKRAALQAGEGAAAAELTVQWLEVRPAGSPAPGALRRPPTAGAAAAVAPIAAVPEPVANDAAKAGGEASVVAAPLDRDALLTQLRESLRTGDDPAMARAIAAAGLSLTDPRRTLDPAVLDGLDPKRRDMVVRYHKLIVELGEKLSKSDGVLTSESVTQLLAGLVPAQPVKIGNVQLCRRVRGFGVYDTFESSAFLAGRNQKMIVYLELTHFKSVKSVDADGNDVHQVKLEQEVALYSEVDGFEVWRQQPVQIVDNSRNARRDFFVVQMVELPARLGVGRFRMKVRVSDTQANTIDEITVPIQFVADQKLVAGVRP
ncbi:MAG: hypothetical protein WD042_02615 [Phycisphaeraceae bacterium]